MIPTLDQVYTAKQIYNAIMREEKEVYIWWFIAYMRFIVDLMPLKMRYWITKIMMGNGMKTFVGRHGQVQTTDEGKKND